MDVLVRLILAQATRLARSGSYRQAEALLDEATAVAGGPCGDILDLRARVRAQQGHYAEAAALWREALALAPDRADYRAALDVVTHASPRRPFLVGIAARAAVALALVLLAWTAAAQRSELRRLRPVGDPRETVAGAPVASSANPPAAAPTDALTASTAAASPVLDSLEAGLRTLTGITLAREGRSLEVRFDDGVFVEGAALRTDASAVVRRLGNRLAPLVSRVAVEVVGHTDPLPLRAGSSYRDNLALGLARASRVAALLLGSGLSADAVAVRTRGDAAPPFSNDTPEGRLRNRTVTLRISPEY